MTSIAEKMVAGGSCIARIDGKAVFIPFALPGETLEIEITERKKDYDFARILSIISPSPHRVDPPCPFFGRCGGCTLQMADAEYQRSLRLSILRDVFARAHVEPECGIRMVCGDPLGYRSRFQFHRASSGGIGLKEGSGSEVVPIADCPVAVEPIRAALKDGSLARIAHGRNASERIHVFGYGDKLWHEDGNAACDVDIVGTRVRFDARGFFQSNIPMLERLIETLREMGPHLAGMRLLDFYAGVGTFSALAGTRFEEVVLVEHNADALQLASINLQSRENAPILCPTSDERWAKEKAARLRYDCAIVDPPRQGLSPKARDWFAASSIPDIRYVSCDPVTLARDARILVAAGYAFKEAILFDFYPQTHHIETLGLFTR